MYHEIRHKPFLSKEENDRRQLYKLNRILNHAYRNVPYYYRLLQESGTVKNGKITIRDLSELEKIPFLSKDIIREQKQALYANDIAQRHSYKNTSGGSTGEPILFIQDKEYLANNLANFLLARSWRGAGPYDDIVYIWGAERDIFSGKKPFTATLKDFFVNRLRFNSFKMSEREMLDCIHALNKHKPKLIIAYVQSIYDLARFAKKNKIHVEKQNAIHAAAGTLYDFLRKEIEEVFQCEVFNHYGSREVGAIASECSAHDGLHILSEHTLVEVVNEEGRSCEPGEKGEIVVTTLNNYSMPLIRYKIGDIGIKQAYRDCACGCSYPKLQKVVGRSTDIFTTKAGSKVYGAYFTHLFYYYDWIKNFQVIQKDSSHILVKIVKIGDVNERALDDIRRKIKLVMGEECQIEFQFLDEIPKTRTGKQLYTISEVESVYS